MNVFIHKFGFVLHAELSDLNSKWSQNGPAVYFQNLKNEQEWNCFFSPCRAIWGHALSLASLNKVPTLPMAHFVAVQEAIISLFKEPCSGGSLGRHWQQHQSMSDLFRLQVKVTWFCLLVWFWVGLCGLIFVHHYSPWGVLIFFLLLLLYFQCSIRESILTLRLHSSVQTM